MDRDYSIGIVDGVMVTRFTRAPDVLVWQTAMRDVASADTSGRRLWDLSCGAENLTGEEIRGLAELAKRTFTPPGRVAFLAPQDLAYGLARMHDVFRAQEGVKTQVFRNEQAALGWLALASDMGDLLRFRLVSETPIIAFR